MITNTLALCATVVLSSADGRTCSCVTAMRDADAVARSQVVFVGRPLRSRTYVAPDGLRRRIYTFAVTRWRKGSGRGRVEVETRMGGGDCGIRYTPGRTYTVYGHAVTNGRVGTTQCDVPLETQMGLHSGRRR